MDPNADRPEFIAATQADLLKTLLFLMVFGWPVRMGAGLGLGLGWGWGWGLQTVA